MRIKLDPLFFSSCGPVDQHLPGSVSGARFLILMLFAGGLLGGSANHAAAQARGANFISIAVPASEPSFLERLMAKPLLIPVAGVHLEQLRDSYLEARSGGREHQGIDIMAPRGTPVLAVADGRIVKLHQGPRGGNSIYQLDSDGRTRYYYAHLDRYADGLARGKAVSQGDTIGYVGDTGNARPGDCHLHFSIARLDNVRRWWEGSNLNPYTIFRTAVAITRMAPAEAAPAPSVVSRAKRSTTPHVAALLHTMR